MAEGLLLFVVFFVDLVERPLASTVFSPVTTSLCFTLPTPVTCPEGLKVLCQNLSIKEYDGWCEYLCNSRDRFVLFCHPLLFWHKLLYWVSSSLFFGHNFLSLKTLIIVRDTYLAICTGYDLELIAKVFAL